MAFPKTFDEMKASGYVFSNDAACRGCGDDIEWWETPNGKKIPMNPMTSGSSPAIAHWSTCSDAPAFGGEAMIDLCSCWWVEWRELRQGIFGRGVVKRWYSCPLERELSMLRRHL